MGADYAKLDPALIAALDDAGERDRAPLPVFVKLSCIPTDAEAEVLSRLGVDVGGARRTTTAHVAPQSIGELSQQPCVAFVQLAQPLKLLSRKDADG